VMQTLEPVSVVLMDSGPRVQGETLLKDALSRRTKRLGKGTALLDGVGLRSGRRSRINVVGKRNERLALADDLERMLQVGIVERRRVGRVHRAKR
jgi:hypothetical protein